MIFLRKRFKPGMAVLCTVMMFLSILAAGCKGEAPSVSVQNARVEFSEVMRDEASVYLKIVNAGGKDRLMGARVDIPGTTTTIHEMRGDIMVEAKALNVPPKGDLELMSIGLHVMISGLPSGEKVGDRFTLTLLFERTGEVKVPLEFTKPRLEPMKPDGQHHH